MDAFQTATANVLLDLQRCLLVLGKCLKFGIFPFAGVVPLAPYRKASFPVRLRRCIEDLGLTYLKLGQFLAMRFDILPAEVCNELTRLFENVPPMSAQDTAIIVESELNGPINRFFSSFNFEPIAAASVAQVHDARTIAGERVAVKVQRGGLTPIFKADIRNLKRLAALAQFLGVSGKLLAKDMVEQFSSWTLRELDFRIEGRTAERVQRHAQAFVVIPKVEWSLSTARVLTMQFVDGVSASNLRQFLETSSPEEIHKRLPGFDLDSALRHLAKASFSQLFAVGFFHGDPHPGNILFLPNSKVAFLDFGIFGRLTESEREIVTGQIENLAVGNITASFRYYAKQVAVTEDTDLERFRSECLEVLKRWFAALSNSNSPIGERHLARYTGEMINVSRRNGLIYDLNYLLFWRALNNLNATLWRVKPDFDLIHELRVFFEELRPDPFERTLAAVRQPDWRRTVAGLLFDFPARAERGLDKILEADTVWSATVSWSAWTHRQAVPGSARPTVLLVVWSLIMLEITVPMDWPLRVALGIVFSIVTVATHRQNR